mgnify:CR=1 FL=1
MKRFFDDVNQKGSAFESFSTNIKSAKDMKGLMDVWSRYESLQSDKEFVAAMTAKKTQLKNNA